MKARTKAILGLAIVAVLSFGGGALYQRHRTLGWVEALRQQPVSPQRMAESVPKMAPSRADEILLLLHQQTVKRNSTAFYNFGIYNRFSGIWSRYRKQPPTAILEIGPGRNLAPGVVFVMAGVNKYYGLDIYRDPDFYKRHSYEAVVALLTTVAPSLIKTSATEVFRIEGDTAVFNEGKLQYLYPYQSYDLPIPPGSVDYIYSNAVFEHITDPAATITSMFRILPSKALTAHVIDMRDHRDFSKPLEFLKEDREAWEKGYKAKNAHNHTNRWRLSDFKSAFEKAGFRILATDPIEKTNVTDEVRKSLHPDFQKYSLEDLSLVIAIIVAEKP
jgi:SAM-dependent methyltransferase